jgi:hypothetical protein
MTIRREKDCAVTGIEDCPVINDARVLWAILGSTIGIVFAITGLLHMFGVFSYESRLTVLETNIQDIKGTISRIEGKIDGLKR